MILLPRAVASTRVTAYFRISAMLVSFGLGLMLSLSAITVAPVAHAQDSAQDSAQACLSVLSTQPSKHFWIID